MTTMVLGGLWHGAAWNFVLWGFYQGAVLSVYRLLAPGTSVTVPPTHPGPVPERGWRERPLSFAASIGVFFVLTVYGWLLFRAASLEQVLRFTTRLFADFGNLATAIKKPTLSAEAGLAMLFLLELSEYVAGSRTFYRSWPRPVRGLVYALLVFILLMGLSNAPAQFIYFQF
jgi:D-alanyl-lipoteichoic acid acyltransferase DltB (MBOAT superfamily)